MKKIFVMLLMSVILATVASAQVKNVKKAYRLSEAYENPDFYAAEEQIEPALTLILGGLRVIFKIER